MFRQKGAFLGAIVSGSCLYVWKLNNKGDIESHCASVTSPPAELDYRPVMPAPSKAVLLAEYRTWLTKHGVNISKVNINLDVEETATQGAIATLNSQGAKDFSSGFLGTRRLRRLNHNDPVLAEIPISTAINYDSVKDHHIQGPALKNLMENDGQGDGYPMAIHLMIEKMKGEKSYLKTWIKTLPNRFSCPISWTVDEIEWLRGTSLYNATL